jgi:hypothetical protein
MAISEFLHLISKEKVTVAHKRRAARDNSEDESSENDSDEDEEIRPKR